MVETPRVSASTPATALSFAGQVDLEGRPVTVAVTVAGGVVSLLVGEDSIGSWEYGDIEFVEDAEGTYSMRADGDSLVFRPAEHADFRDFIASRSTSPPFPNGETNGTNHGDHLRAVEFSIPVRSEADVSTPPPSIDEHSNGIGLEPLTFPEDGPSMDWEPETDEYFAAGLNGPPVEGASAPPKMRFNRLPAVPEQPPAPPTEIPRLPHPEDAEAEAVSDPTPVAVPPERHEATATPVTPTESGSLSTPGPTEPPVDPEPNEAVPKESMLQRRSRMKAEKADRAGASSPDEPVSVTERLGANAPMNDRENLRQWALIIGGAVVGLGLLGVVGWVLIAAMGGEADTPDPATATTISVATTLPAPTTTPPTIAIEADPEATADAAKFISQWNALASTYAYHMAISADAILPIETAVTPAIRITYATDRSVTIHALPQGERGDRDLLIAMGMVVAWAEPHLSPAARGDVLGSLGIDIEDPQLESVGGELSRSGVVYEANVLDRVLRFTARR
ncbi:hypothetical protein BH23ACT5_BH23ACT5_09420 [soil metagenome]